MAALCSLSYETVTHGVSELKNTQLITLELLSEFDVFAKVNEILKIKKTNTQVQLISALNFLQLAVKSNSFVSSSNTNAVLLLTITDVTDAAASVAYIADKVFSISNSTCVTEEPVFQVFFYMEMSNVDLYQMNFFDKIGSIGFAMNNVTMVNGFFIGSYPLNGILASKLDCLYDVDCLQIWQRFFPTFSQVC